ncbi:beta-galactosidase [Streptomyces sp. GESEQ-35]|uniref:beta-galactosidase n=1 Tax=Streptomyces sp. GESEQ-35 TaxID=2812657 RepID=UPI001B338510|nr:beta-galactosidase [Streptomyces sp. GESEQ-35]
MRLTRRQYLLGVLAVLAVLAVLLLVLGAVRLFQHEEAEEDYFGTLQTDPAKARVEYESGIRIAHLPLDWARFEPADDSYDSAYADSVKETIRTFHATGAHIEVGLGLNHPPEWLRMLHPETQYVNQFGERYAETPNIVFSQVARDEVAEYIRYVADEIGLDNFWSIRVGVSEAGEFSYPPPVSQRQDRNEYWAFDPAAQAASPFPGWRPGQRTYEGKPFTERQVEQWYDWYLAVLSNTINWQLDQYTSLGYDGRLHVLVPGAGYYPSDLRRAIQAYLDGPAAARLMGRGVGFFRTIDQIDHRDNVHIVSTALVDGSGNVPNNGCEPTDSAVNIYAEKNSTVRDWSSVRWVTALAKRAGFTGLGGESAGEHVAPYRPGVMEDAMHQMISCDLDGIMWAFDSNLYDGTPGSSLREYADVIDRHSRR